MFKLTNGAYVVISRIVYIRPTENNRTHIELDTGFAFEDQRDCDTVNDELLNALYHHPLI